MTPLFWIAVALDAAAFVILLVLGLTQSGPSDGGREMSLIFGVLVPGIVVGGGALLFLKSESTIGRATGLLIVGGPGLFLAGARLRSASIDYQVRQNSNGSGYFSRSDLKRAGRAVVQLDVPALHVLKGRIEVNAEGRHRMTLMALAIAQAGGEPPPGTAEATSGTPLAVIRELLALGANPNVGLEAASKLPNITILTTLLDAGAKPDYSDDQGRVVFRWLGVMPLANFTALLDHGLDVNLLDEMGTPLVIALARNDRWDLVLRIIALGADPLRADGSGMHLADVVQSRVESTSDRPPEMKSDIARVKSQLVALKAYPATR